MKAFKVLFTIEGDIKSLRICGSIRRFYAEKYGSPAGDDVIAKYLDGHSGRITKDTTSEDVQLWLIEETEKRALHENINS